MLFVIRRVGDVCTSDFPATVRYSTPAVSATSGSDYTPNGNTETVPVPGTNHSSVQISDPVATLGDAAVEPVETLRIQFSVLSGANRIQPWDLPGWIIDVDGSDRADLGPLDSWAKPEGSPTVKIPVVRQGPISGSAAVNWSLTPVTASSSDFTGSSGTLFFPAGSTASDRIRDIQFQIVNDQHFESSETLQISLTGATGTSVASSTPQTFTITDNEEGTPPRTRFHHPRHKLEYRFGDYRIREVHAFADDFGSPISGVGVVEWALRQNRKDGTYKWWNGSRFVSGGSSALRWLKMKHYSGDNLYYYRLPALPSSMGTKAKAKTYTAYARARDTAGNQESAMSVGRNVSTFEVKRR